MKKLMAVTFLVAMITLSGCLSALHPLFTEKDLAFDPELLGSWRVGGENEVYTFQQGTPENFAGLPEAVQQLAGKAYLLTIASHADGKETSRYYVFRTRIGNHCYLDYFPAQTTEQQGYATFFKKSFVPMHSFFRLKPGADPNTMTIGQFADSYLRKLIDKKQIRISHEQRADGSYVITAPTEELQQYVVKYGEVDEAYQDNKTYTRIR